MAIDFPNTPAPISGDTYTAPNGQLYVFDGQKWIGAGTAQPDQSDWNETDDTSLAFIRNKPNISFTDTDTLDSVTDRGNTTSNSITTGDHLPEGTSNTKNLGSPTQRWHTLYVGPGSLNIDGISIGNSGTNLTVGAPLHFNNGITFDGSYNQLSDKPDLFSGDYGDLDNKPSIPADISELTDSTNLLFSGDYGDLSNTPSIPADISELTDSTNLLFSGDYGDLDNKPNLSGYLTAESDTLDDVTDRGSTTTNSISVGALTLTNATSQLTFQQDGSVQTTAFPSYLLNTDEHVIYVSKNGDDLNNGLRPTTAFRTVKAALNYVALNPTNRSIVNILAGIYEEIFPLTIPANTLVRGAGLKAVEIHPTTGTRSNDCFYLDNNTGVTDLTIREQLYNSGSNTGYAFRYNPAGVTITERSPYVERVTVLQKGSVTSSSDPYGFNQGDAGRGVFIDGSRVNRGSIEPAMLFNECTFFTPNSRCLIMTNGARCEWLNCFSYFADLHYEAYFGDVGYGGAGKTYITLVGKAGTWSVGNTLRLYANNGVTILGSGTIEAISGSQLTLTGNVTGLLTNASRTANTIIVTSGAAISTTQFKFSPSALALNGSTDYINIATTPNYAFGTGDFAVEGWVYPSVVGGGFRTIFDQRTATTDVALQIEMSSGGTVRVYINGTTRISQSGSLSPNVWAHIAYARVGGVGRLFINGVSQGTYADGNNYQARPLFIGAQFNGTNNFGGYIDEVRVSKGIGRYSATFSVATQPFTGDSNTVTLLHFTGANGSTSIVDDGQIQQDVRSSGGGTATGITRYDRSEFGALLRANSGAMVYGNQGAKATGAVSTSREDVVLQLMSYNIAYIGTGADLSNNRSTVVAANEAVEVSGGRIIYVSVDQSGKFKVGDLFVVDFETGGVTFSGPSYNVTSLSGITFTSGSTTTYIDGAGINTGNLVLAGNTISTTTGNIILDPSGTSTISLHGDTTVTGALTVTNGVTFGANGTQTQAINYLNDLLDVNIAGTPTNGYVLKYNSGTGQWGPAPDLQGSGGGGGVDLSVIYVTTTTASGGGSLSYDGAGQFTFAPADVSSFLTASSLSGYATQTWVTNQGYLTGITSGQVTGALGYTPLQASDLSVTTNTASGGGSLSYSNGVFTFTPPSLSSYLTASSLSVTTASASGSGSLSYLNGVFTFTPPSLSSYLTSAVTSVSGTGTVNGITLSGTVTSTGSLTLGGTLSGIGNTQLTNSSITVNGSTISLGGSATITAVNPNALTISSPLSGTSYNGSSAVTIALSSGYGDTQNPYASKTTNYFLAAPNGTAGVPSFRAIVAADIPTLNQNTTGSAGSVANALTIGTGLSGTVSTYNGSAAVTISNAGVTSITTNTGLSTNTSATGAVTITNSGVTSIVAGSGISVSGATGAVTVSATGSPTFTNVTVTGQIVESFQTYNTAITGSPSITFNCTNGNIWRVNPTGGPGSAWTALFTNVAVTTGQVTNITMIITQGTTPFIPSAISINGTSVTPAWQGGSTPTGNASKQDAIAYGVMQTGASTYTVYAQLVSFG